MRQVAAAGRFNDKYQEVMSLSMPGAMKLDEEYLRRLFSVPVVDSFDISDGGSVAYSSDLDGQFQLYLQAAGGNRVQITRDGERKISPHFAGNNRLLYFSDAGGNEEFDLYRVSLEAGGNASPPVNMTPDTEFSLLPRVSCSSDFAKCVMVSNREGNFATYMKRGLDGELVRITDHAYSDDRADISPDGKMVAVTSLVSGQDSAVFMVTLGSGEEVQVTDPATGKMLEASGGHWSPDGRLFAISSTASGYSNICLYNIATRELNQVTEGERESHSPVISPDGKWIAYTTYSGGSMNAVVHPLGGGDETVASPGKGCTEGLKFSGDSTHMYFIFSGSRNSADLFSFRLTDGRREQLTRCVPAYLDTTGFTEGREVSVRNSDDAVDIPALLYVPAARYGASGLPGAVHIHGGPAWHAMNMWKPMVQALVSMGIAVIEPNYRGSTGYGKKFRDANRHVMGKSDLADCVYAADYLIREGIADPARVAVMGGSFGGYLTMCALTKYPGRWRCGSAIVPFLNWFTEMENEREDLRYWDSQNMGDPVADRERLREASPVFFLDRIDAPVQIIAGANDPRCPLSESLQAKEKMERLGKSIDFKYYEGEGHSFSGRKNRIDHYMRVIKFVSEHLHGG